jgi:hypothetical protein
MLSLETRSAASTIDDGCACVGGCVRGPLPGWFYGDFDHVDTHASASPPVSAERPTWPVLLFLPGWDSPREDYSALCADLASRSYVVIALSHPYESAVSVLADGRVVGATAGASVFGANMADMTPIRAADSRFVLDQVGRLAQLEPGSAAGWPLDGRGGRRAGGGGGPGLPRRSDGILPAVLAGGWPSLGAPFLWLQSVASDWLHSEHAPTLLKRPPPEAARVKRRRRRPPSYGPVEVELLAVQVDTDGICSKRPAPVVCVC